MTCMINYNVYPINILLFAIIPDEGDQQFISYQLKAKLNLKRISNIMAVEVPSVINFRVTTKQL